jgi:acyl dehydratase
MTLAAGQTLPTLERGPITTRQLVEYAGASLDFNRIHYDEPFAKAGGFPSVIAHGMLSMAFLAQLVAQVAGTKNIRQLQARFKAVAFPGDTLRVSGEVARVENGEAHLAVRVQRPDGTVAVEGTAIVALH